MTTKSPSRKTRITFSIMIVVNYCRNSFALISDLCKSFAIKRCIYFRFFTPFNSFGVRSMQEASVFNDLIIDLAIYEQASLSFKVFLKSLEKTCLFKQVLGVKSVWVWIKLLRFFQLFPVWATMSFYSYVSLLAGGMVLLKNEVFRNSRVSSIERNGEGRHVLLYFQGSSLNKI